MLIIIKNTKAVILAGGLGTRLRPLTCTKPKPLCKIHGESVLERLLRMLSETNIYEVVISTMYMSQEIINFFGNSYKGIKINYVIEKEPLGSAGGTKYALKASDINATENVLVLSGDGIFDFNLSEIISYHIKKDSDVTIVTTPTDNPLEYGVIQNDESGKITSIIEKPSWANIKTNTVNTGIYIFKSKIFDYIPDNRFFDFSKDLFPMLIGNRNKLFAYEATGYWCDIGDVSSYYNCNIDALSEKINNIATDDKMSYDELDKKGLWYEKPCYISRNSQIHPDAKIGKFSIVEKNAIIEENTRIDYSIILDGVNVGKNSEIHNSIICENVNIGNNTEIRSGCTIGSKTVIEDNVVINNEIIIWPNKIIEKGYYVNQDILFNSANKNLYTEDGYNAGEINQKVDTEYLTRLGKAISDALKEKISAESSTYVPKIGVMHNGKSECSLIAETILCASRSNGIKTYTFLNGFEAQAKFAASRFMTDLFIYITSDTSNRIIKIFDNSANYISRDLERRIDFYLKNQSEKASATIYDSICIDSLKHYYKSSLYEEFYNYPKGYLSDFNCNIYIDETKDSPNLILYNILKEFGVNFIDCQEDNCISVSISDNGFDASIKQISEKGSIFFDSFHIKAALFAYQNSENNNTQANVNSIESLSPDELLSDFDMCRAILRLFIIMKKENITLYDLFSALPAFDIYVKNIDINELGKENRASVMRELSEKHKDKINLANKEGINLIFDSGNITVVPRRSGGFKIISEAISTECAMENALEIENIIKSL